jgi:hypothetical protein
MQQILLGRSSVVYICLVHFEQITHNGTSEITLREEFNRQAVNLAANHIYS